MFIQFEKESWVYHIERVDVTARVGRWLVAAGVHWALARVVLGKNVHRLIPLPFL